MMMNKQKLLNLLGLAQSASKLVSGEETVERSIRAGRIKLVFLACDASENTSKAFENLSAYYNVPMLQAATKDEMGQCIGKSRRAVIGVMDDGFAKRMIDLMNKDDATIL